MKENRNNEQDVDGYNFYPSQRNESVDIDDDDLTAIEQMY